MTAPDRETTKRVARILSDPQAKGCADGRCRRRATPEKFIHGTNNPNMTDGSLSTFDSGVSCLYFFETESRNACLKQHPERRMGILHSAKRRRRVVFRRAGQQKEPRFE
ncbi:hypothetical protein ACLK1G_09630 [Pseudomonas sp. NR3]|uniref:hypothetical protein n=1 Tax=Pseudomonas sp. NR3 TaxID=3155978 RepID=UPI003B675E89